MPAPYTQLAPHGTPGMRYAFVAKTEAAAFLVALTISGTTIIRDKVSGTSRIVQNRSGSTIVRDKVSGETRVPL